SEAPRARRAGHLHPRFQRDQALAEIARIGRDAGIAYPEHRMRTIEALDRGAAGPRRALVAIRIGSVAKIRAPRALEHVAAERRHVADLLAGRKRERLRDHRIVARDEW